MNRYDKEIEELEREQEARKKGRPAGTKNRTLEEKNKRCSNP